MLLGTLRASLLGNLLTGKDTQLEQAKALLEQVRIIHSLTNFEIQKYYQNEPEFIGEK